MYAIYRDSCDLRSYVLRLFDAEQESPVGSDLYRDGDLGEVRSFLAERCESRLENYERESRHPESLIELWIKPRR